MDTRPENPPHIPLDELRELDDVHLAAALVREAGELAAQMRLAGLRTEYKTSISDVVSAADHAAEELIATRLRAARPGDALLGEEGTELPGTPAAPGTGRRWVIDPVDGTYNFLSGIDFWCSALALEDLAPVDLAPTDLAPADADSGTNTTAGPVLGAVFRAAGPERGGRTPAGAGPGAGDSSGELWLGGREHPATCNGVRLPRLADRPLAEVCISTYVHPPRLGDATLREPVLRAISGAATVRMLGSGSVEMAYVAAGRLGLWLHPNTKPWDWLPGAALVRAAGGVAEVVRAHGHRWHLAGNRQAVEEAIALLVKPVAGP